jgi:two-component system OmpR family response regulator
MPTLENYTLNQETLMLVTSRRRVLCVDDDEDARAMLVTLLGLASMEAKAVGSAPQALALIQSEHFDLYMLDGWLPEIDGFELCRKIRALDSHNPIVFFSGAAYAADKEKGIAAGADAYVTKPDIHELVARLKQLTANVPLIEALVVSAKSAMHLSNA